MINKKKHRLSIKTRFDTQVDCPSKTGTNNSDAIRQNLINVLISNGYKISMIFASLVDNTKYFRLKMNDPAASNGVCIGLLIIGPSVRNETLVRLRRIKPGAPKMGKERRESNEEITLIGFVKEFEDNLKSYRVGIATENGSYLVRMNEEGKNLQYEVGNKVEATGIITRTKDGRRRIDVTGYEVYEMDEDDLEEFGGDPEYYFSKGS